MSDETMAAVMTQARGDGPAIPDPSVKPTLTVEETAHVLGIIRGGAYEGVRSGDIPSLRIGRRVIVPTAQLRALLGLNPAA